MDQDAELFVTPEDFTEVVTGSEKKSLSISATGPVVRFWCGSNRQHRHACARETRTIYIYRLAAGICLPADVRSALLRFVAQRIGARDEILQMVAAERHASCS